MIRSKWTIRDVLVAMMIFLAAIMLLSVGFAFMVKLMGIGDNPSVQSGLFIILVIIQSLFLFFLSWYFGVKKHNNTFKDLGIREFKLMRGIINTLKFLPLLYLFGIAYNFFTHILGAEIPEIDYIDLFGGNITGFVFAFLIVVIIGPVCEEIFFRGFLYPAFKDSFGKTPGIIISSLIFGLFHLNLWLVIPISLIGLINIFLYERTKSLDSCIILHSANNMLALLALFA